MGFALLLAAATNVFASKVSITVYGASEGGEAVKIEWRFDRSTMPDDVNETSSTAEYRGTNWLSVKVTQLGNIDDPHDDVITDIDDAESEDTLAAGANYYASDVLMLERFRNVGQWSYVRIAAEVSKIFPNSTPVFSSGVHTVDVTEDEEGAFGISYETLAISGTITSVEIESGNMDRSPAEMLEALSDSLGAMNLDHGTANSLDSKLENVLAALLDPRRKNNQAAINQLSAFINSVKAVAGKKMTSGQADNLILQAQAIIAALSS